MFVFKKVILYIYFAGFIIFAFIYTVSIWMTDGFWAILTADALYAIPIKSLLWPITVTAIIVSKSLGLSP